MILVAQVDPRPEAQQALTTLFTSTASQTEVLDAMNWMVGSPKNASTVWERFKDARARSAAASQAAAAQATPLQDWWEPPGDVPYLVIQGMKDEAAPVENGHLLKEELGERGTVVDIPNAGHLQPLEAPGPVAETVIAFAR